MQSLAKNLIQRKRRVGMGSSFGVSLYALCVYIIQLIFKVRSVLTMSPKVTPLLNPRET